MLSDKDIDGGWAWVVLVATSLGMVFRGSTAISPGFLQVEFLKYFSQSTGYTSLVTSMFMCLEFVMGPISSVFCTLFSVRTAMMTGGLLMSLGLVIASFTADIVQLLLAYGVLGGLGFGLSYTPHNIILGYYFNRHQPLANGISLAACGLGLSVGPFVVMWLIESNGWRFTLVALACCSLQFCVVGCLYFPTKREKSTEHGKGRRKIKCGGCSKSETCLWYLKDVTFWIMCINYGLVMVGYGIQIVHFPAYAESLNIRPELLAWLYTTFGIVVSISRVLCGVLCNDKTVDLLMVYFSTQAIQGLITVFMPLYAKDYVGIMTYQVLVSIFYGSSQVPLSPLVVQLFGVHKLSTVFGWMMLWGGVGALVGPVIAGWLHDVTRSYSIGFHVGGVLVMLAAVLLLFVPMCRQREAGEDVTEPELAEKLVHKDKAIVVKVDVKTQLCADVQ
ncbi:monocarboxylate transporter 4-like [Haliotis rubra]|uniref:monocarboxylate transporter 4-like n=1 Tax=Haliotis rubra TaxID=36100 RepID=UPI001EE5A04C|nr:monocarboxylate transporter 4-like [Haliotis rubra]XP_046553545.1 monocarboxylate transporter 4-like [Haliotis rubra]